jgi:hypothetical protein
MTTSARARYTGYRFPTEIIGHAVWLYFRFPLGLRMVEELLASRSLPRSTGFNTSPGLPGQSRARCGEGSNISGNRPWHR